MFKAFKYRLYPTASQANLLNKHIGCARFVYNHALNAKIDAYDKDKTSLSWVDIANQLPLLKTEYEWLKEVNSQSLQQSIMNMDAAFKAFFKKQNNFPKFKKKSAAKQSFRVTQRVRVDEKYLYIPKFKRGIHVVLHKPLKGVLKQATISRTSTGKYFVSVLCDTGETERPLKRIKTESTVGVDLGIKSFLVASDGTEYANPKYLRAAMSKLKYNQRQYSKHKGRRRKHKVAVLHEKVANQRKDFLNKASSELIKNHDSIALEDLNINGMLKNHCLAGTISDVGWGMFVDMLEYKARWNGVNILRIGRFEPSSKTCSECGFINKELTLKDREWACPDCGSMLDRDLNASVNIKNFALNSLSVERRLKNHGTLPSLEGALTHEAQLSG